MPLPLLALGLASGVAQIAGGFLAKKKHEDYADELRALNLRVPDSMYSAENIYRENASKGLPGKDVIEQDVQAQFARSMGLGKEVVDNPSQLLDMMAKSSEATQNNIRQLGVQDATAKQQNNVLLAEFLSRVKSPTELNVRQFNIQKDISAKAEELAGFKELLQGITGGLSTTTSTLGYNSMVNKMAEKNKTLAEYFK